MKKINARIIRIKKSKTFFKRYSRAIASFWLKFRSMSPSPESFSWLERNHKRLTKLASGKLGNRSHVYMPLRSSQFSEKVIPKTREYLNESLAGLNPITGKLVLAPDVQRVFEEKYNAA